MDLDFTTKIKDLRTPLKVGRKSLFLNDIQMFSIRAIFGGFGVFRVKKIHNFRTPPFKRFFKNQMPDRTPPFKSFFRQGRNPIT